MRGEPLPWTNRGVSPVVGVVLLLAIVVILAAVVVIFLLGIGLPSDSASEYVGVKASAVGDTVRFTIVDGTPDAILVRVDSETIRRIRDISAGETITLTGVPSETEITLVARTDGSNRTIYSKQAASLGVSQPSLTLGPGWAVSVDNMDYIETAGTDVYTMNNDWNATRFNPENGSKIWKQRNDMWGVTDRVTANSSGLLLAESGGTTGHWHPRSTGTYTSLSTTDSVYPMTTHNDRIYWVAKYSFDSERPTLYSPTIDHKTHIYSNTSAKPGGDMGVLLTGDGDVVYSNYHSSGEPNLTYVARVTADNTTVWDRPSIGGDMVATTGSAIYVANTTILYKLDPETGATRWTRTYGREIGGLEIQPGTNAVAISLYNSSIYGHELAKVNRLTGDIMWIDPEHREVYDFEFDANGNLYTLDSFGWTLTKNPSNTTFTDSG